ncbi:mannose-1-phosphate guanylyltransferase [Persicobacter diffluens]|uniref:mannose-1-phosphate guanylyltransferase n=1 Tax=Persicobacter diffluens TaxID=981 RepID=A0AAN4VVV8_9BACT|nr:mannose-1-phosphate guanylyltransferase [Persicobacter diffluens]
MYSENNFVVIMAGGIGSRLWPFSRTDRPKQFMDVFGLGKSLLQQTYHRFLPICPRKNIFVVTHEDYRELVQEQLPEIGQDQLLLEPHRRNTAACIAYACYKIASAYPNARIVVSPSDHAIFKEEAFHNCIFTGLESVIDQDRLLTIGLRPHKAETSYGYLQYRDGDEATIKKVKTFTEKPSKEMAELFVDSGDYVWNSGIFIWNVQAIIRALRKHLPDLADVFEEMKGDYFSTAEGKSLQKAYSHCKNISIDYGLMEKAGNVDVILGDFEWTDLGSFQTIHELNQEKEEGNTVFANAMLFDVEDSMVVSEDPETLVVAEGLENYVVAVREKLVVVVKKGNERNYKKIFKAVKNKTGKEYL